MHKFVLGLVAVAALALGGLAIANYANTSAQTPSTSATPAGTSSSGTPSTTGTAASSPAAGIPATEYKVDLKEVNSSGVSGNATLVMTQDGKLSVEINADGLEQGQEHAQHIHGKSDGSAAQCPTSSDDKDGNGTITLTEASASTGPVLLPLTQSQFPMANSEGKVLYANSFNATTTSGTPSAGTTGTTTATSGGAAGTSTPASSGTSASGTSAATTPSSFDMTSTAQAGTSSGTTTPAASGTPAPSDMTATAAAAQTSATPATNAPLTLDKDVIEIHGMTKNGSYDPTLPVACGTIEKSADVTVTPSAGVAGTSSTPGAGGGAVSTPSSSDVTATAASGQGSSATLTPPPSPTPGG